MTIISLLVIVKSRGKRREYLKHLLCYFPFTKNRSRGVLPVVNLHHNVDFQVKPVKYTN
jgi:hypothetical protein